MTQPKPIPHPYHFVISSPRSGSTWLTKALNQHPEILATENRLFGMFCELWKNNNGKTSPRITADRYLRSLATHSFFESLGFESSAEMETELKLEFITFLCDFLLRKSAKRLIVDKVTPYLGTSSAVLSSAEEHFPTAKRIHLIRDGRDVAVSGVFDWIARENEGSDRHKLFVDNESNIRLNRFFDDDLLRTWANYWAEPIRAMALSPLNPKQVMEIRYESMLQNQATELARVFDFLEVDCDPELASRCAEAVTFEKTTGRTAGKADDLAKTRKGVAGDWKNYFTRHDAALFQQLTSDLLKDLGYETDDSWIDRCPEKLDLRSSNAG